MNIENTECCGAKAIMQLCSGYTAGKHFDQSQNWTYCWHQLYIVNYRLHNIMLWNFQKSKSVPVEGIIAVSQP